MLMLFVATVTLMLIADAISACLMLRRALRAATPATLRRYDTR